MTDLTWKALSVSYVSDLAMNLSVIPEPFHELLKIIAYAYRHSLTMHAQLSSGTRCLVLRLSLPLFTYFVNASCEGSGETARSLVIVFADRFCEKFQNPMNWVKISPGPLSCAQPHLCCFKENLTVSKVFPVK